MSSRYGFARALALAGALALGGVACASKAAAPIAVPPVPSNVMPPKIAASGGLTIQPNTAPDIGTAFASVGPTSLVKEGRVWEIRQGDRLVGAVQLASLRARADTRNENDRRAIRQQILPGEPIELDFFGVPVYEAKDGERSIFVWYGKQVFGVMQLKGKIDPDAIANELITVILQDSHWPALPLDSFQQQ